MREKLGEAKSIGGLGFRDIEAFNTTMLVKQIWRMLQFPDSLASQVLEY